MSVTSMHKYDNFGDPWGVNENLSLEEAIRHLWAMRDKAKMFDLDQQGIEHRKREAVELARLRIRVAELDEKAALLALLKETQTLLRSFGMPNLDGATYVSTNAERLRLLVSIHRALGAGGVK